MLTNYDGLCFENKLYYLGCNMPDGEASSDSIYHWADKILYNTVNYWCFTGVQNVC